MVNFDLHRRKIFWVDAALSYMLEHADLDIAGRDLRSPFRSLALVFSDRHALSLGERLLSRRRDDPLCGQIFRVMTVYVTERGGGDARALDLVGTADVPVAHVTWTYDDYRLLPDDGNRYEVIDGDLVVTPVPTTTHQRVSKRIQLALMLQIEERGLGVVYNAPIDVILSATRTVQPDLLVIREARTGIVTERGIEGPPDIIVEILSPSTATVDRNTKSRLYASVGVAEYWIVDPSAHLVEIFELTATGYREFGRFGPGTKIASRLFALDLEVDSVFR
jgi:Uma2 family endonuclease